mmetsp:Transcript_99307/g.138004  ORF Transcript_99307/g.138004 Transcript_99307/m.138004 type:complete len:209 (-) Transcript_99307:68-694(-)
MLIQNVNFFFIFHLCLTKFHTQQQLCARSVDLLLDLLSGLVESILALLEGLIDLLLVLHQEGSDEGLIDGDGTLGLGVVEVNIEDHFSKEVQGDKGQEYSKDAVQEFDNNKDNPVSQPLHVIGIILRFKRLETHVSRVQEAHQRGDESRGNTSNDQKKTNNKTTHNDVTRLKTSLLSEGNDGTALLKVLGDLLHEGLKHILNFVSHLK